MKSLRQNKILNVVLVGIVISAALSFAVNFVNEESGNKLSAEFIGPLKPLTSVIVIKPVVQAIVTPASPALASQDNCELSSAQDYLQTTVSAEIFTKPADCFTLSVSKTVAVQTKLSVSHDFNPLPQIVVYNRKASISSDLGMARMPQSETQASLPIVTSLIALLTIAFIKLSDQSELLIQESNKRINQITPRFEVLRC